MRIKKTCSSIFGFSVNYGGLPTSAVYASDVLTDSSVNVKGFFAIPTNQVRLKEHGMIA